MVVETSSLMCSTRSFTAIDIGIDTAVTVMDTETFAEAGLPAVSVRPSNTVMERVSTPLNTSSGL